MVLILGVTLYRVSSGLNGSGLGLRLGLVPNISPNPNPALGKLV